MNTRIKNKCITKARLSELPITMMWSQGGDLVNPALVPHRLAQSSPAPGQSLFGPFVVCVSLGNSHMVLRLNEDIYL